MSMTKRMELRVSEDDKTAIEEAAELESYASVADYVRHAVMEHTNRLRARHANVTMMPAAQFDALFESLDVPDNAPNLARAFAHKRRFVQR
jgi:uncharacterized protein (DUF1778 family)